MGSIASWLSLVTEDVSLLASAYLPEMLVIVVISLLFWLIRRLFSHDPRSSL